MGLGLGIAVVAGNLMGQSTSAAVVIEDYMWEIPTAGELTPLASGAVSDFHDTWDLDGTDYMPQLTTTVGDEGYWDLDGTDIQPLDV
tara:strand:+ start:56 stop:316 length:261 start_codon:yes stop_codon:yes gene_type:complete